MIGDDSKNPLSQPTTKSVHYRGNPEAYLAAQEEFTLELVDAALRANPPAFPEPPIRRLAMQLLDHVLHDADSIYNGASIRNNINDSKEI